MRTSSTPSTLLSSVPDHHRLSFYGSDDYLAEHVAEFVAEGLRGPAPVVLIATRAHLDAFLAALAQRGVDADAAKASGRIVTLDASETLARVMVAGRPDRARFKAHVGAKMGELAARYGDDVHAYGEMVDELWRAGNHAGALELEALWNEQQHETPFKLLCAYAIGGFAGNADAIDRVCAAHSHVAADPSTDATVRALAKEIAGKKELERTLRAALAELGAKEDALRETQRDLTDFVENAPFPMHSVGPDGTILWANRAALELLGFAADEYVGRNIADFYADPTSADLLARAADGEPATSHEATLRAKDGSIRHVRIEANAQRSNGALVRTRCIMRDVTENKRATDRMGLLYRLARAALASDTERELFDAALDAMSEALGADRVAVLVHNSEGTMRFRAWRGLSDDYRAAVEGHSPWAPGARDPEPILVPDVTRDPAWSSFLPLFARERIGALAFIPLVARGRVIGKVMAYFAAPRAIDATELGLAQAIGDHVAAAIARFTAIEQLEGTVRMHEMFTAVLGHDLRDPLAAMIAAAQVAHLDVDDERVAKTIDRIISSGERMSRMIDQLLDFTRVRLGGTLPLSPKRVDLASVVRASIDELTEVHGRRVELEISGDALGSWDADRLSQLFSNLVVNAIHHGAPDHPVVVRVEANESEARVAVHNRGAIDASRLPTLFEPLGVRERRRADRSRGLGLGLFIAREIARAHGGRIDVRTSPPEGTTFTVVLPRAAVEEPEALDDAPLVRRTLPVAHAEETEFRLLVETVRDYAIFLLDPEGRVRTWNAGARLLKGYETHEIVGKSIGVFYEPADRATGRPQRLLAQASREGHVEDEGWRVRKDGTRFWADVIITALRHDDGRLRGFAKVTRDLTARRAAEDQLRQSEERLRLLVASVRDYAIFMLDPDGRVATWNAGAERLKGYTEREIIGRPFTLFFDPADVAAGKCARQLEQAAGEGRSEDEGWRVRKDGTRFWANAVITAVRNASGVLVGYAKVTRDLTEVRRADNERERLARAEEAVALRDEFLSIAAHEIRTPLTALSLQLEAMLESRLEPNVHERVARVKQSSDRLVDLIESLFDVSRMAAGALTLRRERLDLRDAVAQVVASEERAAERVRSTLTITPGPPVVGSFDRVRVEQISANLIANAIKFGAGGPITVTVGRDGDDAVLTVADRGRGIAEEDLTRIFGRFQRAAPIQQYGGLGLGLYVTQQVVDAHGGTVVATSPEEGGACFIVRLPLWPT
jgi:PAS domain S-box-containing protein